MQNAFRLYLRFLGISWRSQMEYRASYLMQAVGNFLITGVEFVGVWALFSRFGQVKGWQFAEVALLYGLVNASFAITEFLAGGFHYFTAFVKSGDFDRFLLRPRSTALQVMGQKVAVKNFGRFFQGVFIIIWAMNTLDISWSFDKILLLCMITLGAICLFYGLFILQATMAFWTTESIEAMNILTYGGTEVGGYPFEFYPRWIRALFIFIVPIGATLYYPLLSILERKEALSGTFLLPWLLPLLGFVFLLVSLGIWQIGVRHYTSTGS